MLEWITLSAIKRTILFFWAAWLSAVAMANVLDALQALGALPASFRFVSGNWHWIIQVMDSLGVPRGAGDPVLGGYCVGGPGGDAVLVGRRVISRTAVRAGDGGRRCLRRQSGPVVRVPGAGRGVPGVPARGGAPGDLRQPTRHAAVAAPPAGPAAASWNDRGRRESGRTRSYEGILHYGSVRLGAQRPGRGRGV